jgi:predicted RND superfamily exporter protein
MRKTSLLIAIVTVAVVLFGLSRIRFDVDILRLLPANLPQVEGMSLFLKHFSRSNELILTVDSKTPEDAEAAATTIAGALAKRTDLAARVVDKPLWENSPGDLAELAAYLLINAPPDQVRDSIARTAPDQVQQTLEESLSDLADSTSPMDVMRLGQDPLRFSDALGGLAQAGAGSQPGEFSSADGTFRVLYIEAAPKLTDYRNAITWVNEVKALASSLKLPQGTALGFTGEPVFMAEISASMQFDMQLSGILTLIIVAAIFWLCHRHIRPLFYLLALLVLIFVLTLGIAGIFLPDLTVMGVGFASIMIGLSVDYGYVLYQTWARTGKNAAELRSECRPFIFWAAFTTAAAFFLLNFSSLPGLSQLGSMVGIGVLVGAVVMLLFFAKWIAKLPWHSSPHPALDSAFGSATGTKWGAIVAIAIVFVSLGALAVRGFPPLDPSTNAFRPRHSQANEALEKLSARLVSDKGFLNIIVSGKTPDEVLHRLQETDTILAKAKADGIVDSYMTPLPLWPNAANQAANLPALAPLAKEKDRLRAAFETAGFTEDAFRATSSVLDQWAKWSASPTPIWPSSPASEWIFRRIASSDENISVALGIVHPAAGKSDALAALQTDHIQFVGWERLGEELKHTIPAEFVKLVIILSLIVLVLLYVAFQNFADVLLAAGTMALVFLTLLGTMALLGMQWNLFNLAAILLMLGTGVDYSIYMILALRQHPETQLQARSAMGKVIFQCAASAVAGFGSLSWVSNVGLASMGQTCAIGLTLDALIAIYLLPAAWRFVHRKGRAS